MPSENIIFKEDQVLLGKHLKSNEWICYTGNLTIYNRKKDPIILIVRKDTDEEYIGYGMDEEKSIKGKTVGEVFAKFSRFFIRHGVILQN